MLAMLQTNMKALRGVSDGVTSSELLLRWIMPLGK